jgi:hypothetical protein
LCPSQRLGIRHPRSTRPLSKFKPLWEAPPTLLFTKEELSSRFSRLYPFGDSNILAIILSYIGEIYCQASSPVILFLWILGMLVLDKGEKSLILEQ